MSFICIHNNVTNQQQQQQKPVGKKWKKDRMLTERQN